MGACEEGHLMFVFCPNFSFFFSPCAAWLVESQFPDQGLNPRPRQWKRGVLHWTAREFPCTSFEFRMGHFLFWGLHIHFSLHLGLGHPGLFLASYLRSVILIHLNVSASFSRRLRINRQQMNAPIPGLAAPWSSPRGIVNLIFPGFVLVCFSYKDYLLLIWFF